MVYRYICLGLAMKYIYIYHSFFFGFAFFLATKAGGWKVGNVQRCKMKGI